MKAHDQVLFDYGRMAEEIAIDFEIARLGGGMAAAARVKDVSTDTNLGYDIESFDSVGEISPARFIEVKKLARDGSFLISKNEIEKLTLFEQRGFLYLVDINSGTVSVIVQAPFSDKMKLELTPETFRGWIRR